MRRITHRKYDGLFKLGVWYQWCRLDIYIVKNLITKGKGPWEFIVGPSDVTLLTKIMR